MYIPLKSEIAAEMQAVPGLGEMQAIRRIQGRIKIRRLIAGGVGGWMKRHG